MNDGSLAQLIVRTTCALAAVIGLIYLAAYLGRRAQSKGLIRTAGAGKRVRVVDSVKLGSDAWAHLLEVDGREVLACVTRTGAQLLELSPGTWADVEASGAGPCDGSDAPDSGSLADGLDIDPGPGLGG